MNRIVREHYPVADLPEDLRAGLPADVSVRVVVEVEAEPVEPVERLSMKELLAMRKPPYRSLDEIVDSIRRQRDEWDD